MIDVSVIIPTRNRVELLKRAIKSIKNQKCDFKMEIIVVDDSDNRLGPHIIEPDLHNVRYFYTGGKKGGSIARNIGIENAVGEYVAFLDDDDEWKEDKLAIQLDIMSKNSREMCYTATIVTNSKGKNYYVFHKPEDDQYKSIMKKNFIGTTSSVIVKKEILKKIGGFDPCLPALQDYDLYIRIFKYFKTEWTELPLTIYYSDSSNDKVSESRENYLKARKIFFNKYSSDPFFNYLKRSLNYIFFLKCFRSKKFLFDTLKSLIKI